MSESREDFDARLRRTLRRPVGAAPVELKSAEPLPEWYVRRRARETERPANQAAACVAAAMAPATEHVRTRGMPLRLATESNARGSYGVRIERFAAGYTHGSSRLDAVLAARGEPLALLTGDATLADFDPRTATFLDIETTGLSGGAGTQVFQIGLLDFNGVDFELWQGFLRSPDEAAALLLACAERVRRRGALVSFFGKSFDRHRLEDQMRLHHVEPPFAGRAHLDLYHPCRRLYGKAFADGRLATMERELCNVQRERDLPGAFAPAAWFDFLAGREHLLEAVFLHNRLDVLSLAALCDHLSQVLDMQKTVGATLAGPSLARARALAELFTKRRDWPRALLWSERALLDAHGDLAAQACRARALERCGRCDEARAAFARLASDADDGLAAEALAEVALLAARAGEFEAALEAACGAENRAAGSLTGTRSARLARQLVRVRKLAVQARARNLRPIEPWSTS